MTKVNRKREYFISYSRWACQCIVWCFIASLAKVLCLVVQFKTFGFNTLAGLIVALVNFDARIKLLAVVVLFPILANIFQFLVQDLILKMKNLHTSDYEIVCKYYETVLERESHYQEYNYFSKQTELSSLDEFKIDAKY